MTMELSLPNGRPLSPVIIQSILDSIAEQCTPCVPRLAEVTAETTRLLTFMSTVIVSFVLIIRILIIL